MSTKTVLITGASSGIGEASARLLGDLGFEVYAAARRLDRLEKLADAGIHPVRMDVTSEDSMREGVERVIGEAGRLDVLVNNAGYGSYGAIEDVSMDEARHQFEVNVFGAMRLTQLVLPQMRAQGRGRVINVTSMGGKIHTPLGGWYHATKFALEALSDCLRVEMKPFGVDVVVIEPGGIRTEWGGIAADNLRAVSGGSPYERAAAGVADRLSDERLARYSSKPELIAHTIARAATAMQPRTRYAVGLGAKPMLAARAVLPDRAFDAVIGRVVWLPRE